MATPHDDAPPAHEPDCLPPEPCVCAGLRATADTVTTADLDLVDRLDREATPEPWTAGEEDEDGIVIFAGQGRGHGFGELWNARRGPDSRFIAAARTLLPRLARALRAAIGDPESYAYQQGHARGRREAIEEAIRVAREWTSTRDADVMAELLNAWLARGSK